MLWLDEKFIHIISGRLSLFKKVRQNSYVFRCPLCGDSKKNPYKTRGGLYVPPGADCYNMGCFNCGASMKFSSFLETQDKSLYDEYRLETFKEKFGGSTFIPTKTAQPKTETASPKVKKFDMTSLTRLDMMDSSHPAMDYIRSRMIPKSQWNRLFYCPQYVKWVSAYNEKKFDPKIEHTRLIIPFFDRYGNVTRVAARAFGNEANRYLYTVSDRNSTRLYGLDSIDAQKPVYVLEGPLDSLFIPNAIAVGMASYTDHELTTIQDKIFVPDNEPRNRQVCEGIYKMVRAGEKVCIWQKDTPKDINQIIQSGMSVDDLMRLINDSTYRGLEAELKYKEWIRF
jgi:hypothetical protein